MLSLGLVNFFMLYYGLIITPVLKAEAELVPIVQFHNFRAQ